jgi:hypothetical protein
VVGVQNSKGLLNSGIIFSKEKSMDRAHGLVDHEVYWVHKTMTANFRVKGLDQMGEGVSLRSNLDRSRENGRQGGDLSATSGGWASVFGGAMVEAQWRRRPWPTGHETRHGLSLNDECDAVISPKGSLGGSDDQW